MMMRPALAAAALAAAMGPGAAGLTEQDRMAEFERRGHTWPPTYQPDTPEYRAAMERRRRQLEANPSTQEKWDAYIGYMGSVLAPAFTEYGFAKVQAPRELHREVLTTLADKVGGDGGGGASQHMPEFADWGLKELYSGERPELRREEPKGREIGVIQSDDRPTFYDNKTLTSKILRELQPMHEAWSRKELVPVISYGFRFYHNESSLLMHTDKMHDHVVSSIFHIDHSADSEPWPLLIEGFDGRTHAVTLQPGEMLFYESAKCMHGRPRIFSGSWYVSVFTHYRPTDWHLKSEDVIYAIPPDWNRVRAHDDLPPLRLISTGFYEPCEGALNNWCTPAVGVDPAVYDESHLVNPLDHEAPEAQRPPVPDGVGSSGGGEAGGGAEEAAAAKRELSGMAARRKKVKAQLHAEAAERGWRKPKIAPRPLDLAGFRGNKRLEHGYSAHVTDMVSGLSDNQQGWIVFVVLLLVVLGAVKVTSRGNAEKKGL